MLNIGHMKCDVTVIHGYMRSYVAMFLGHIHVFASATPHVLARAMPPGCQS